MIQVESLVKMYGQVAALRGVSFDVPSGQVLGFLGPNGAGKSTTMKIVTGFLYATSGRVVVDGIDVATDPLGVRRRVGYLPETNPLYTGMRVDDYLRFVGEVRRLRGAVLRDAMSRVIEHCGLAPVYKKGIIELSKGFRQRVGLAQAMIHDPDILILDEPTSGLDPNQIVEIRQLVRTVGANRTVILSTHYLQEVEACCDRIMIVAGGQIVADGSLNELTDKLPGGALTAEFIGPREVIESQLSDALPGARIELLPAAAVNGAKRHKFRIEVRREIDRDVREAIFDLTRVNDWKLVELHRETASLEDVFHQLTAKPGTAAAGAVSAVAAAASEHPVPAQEEA